MPQQDNTELEEAVKLIDAIKKIVIRLAVAIIDSTEKKYADEKPTNDSVRVKSPELDKFCRKMQIFPLKSEQKKN